MTTYPNYRRGRMPKRTALLKRYPGFGEVRKLPPHPMRPEWLYSTPENTSLVFFDIETTGGNPHNAAMTEIAAIRYDAGKETKRFYSLVNPNRYIPKRVQELTGIRPEMVKNAPNIEDIIEDLINFIGDAVLISHGVISDFSFIAHYAEKYLNQTIKNYYICTHLLAANYFPEIPSKSLSGIAGYFDIETDNAHRAEADAVMTANIFWKMFTILENNSYKTIEDLLKLQGDQFTIRRLGSGILLQEIEDKAPTSPGIFLLYNDKREVSYLSASDNLKKSLNETTKLGNEKELNKILVDSRDFKFLRTPHFLNALIEEKKQLKKLQLPLDPRKIQGRSHGIIQILIPSDLLEYCINNPTKIPFKLPTDIASYNGAIRLSDEIDGLNTDEETQKKPKKSTDVVQNFSIRKSHRLGHVKHNEKFQINRNKSSDIVRLGLLTQGVGWILGPFEKANSEFDKLLLIINALGISDTSKSKQERVDSLWLLIECIHGIDNEENKVSFLTKMIELIKSPSIIKIINTATNYHYKAIKNLFEKYSLVIPAEKCTRTGLAIITNPETKELDVAVVVKGFIRKIIKLPSEQSDKISSSRFFTRLFYDFNFDIENPLTPVLFTTDVCSEIELFLHWILHHGNEGEWVDFNSLSPLYSTEII